MATMASASLSDLEGQSTAPQAMERNPGARRGGRRIGGNATILKLKRAPDDSVCGHMADSAKPEPQMRHPSTGALSRFLVCTADPAGCGCHQHEVCSST